MDLFAFEKTVSIVAGDVAFAYGVVNGVAELGRPSAKKRGKMPSSGALKFQPGKVYRTTEKIELPIGEKLPLHTILVRGHI
ncbi:hypothetical protein [Paenibacillus woosongensis]|uniref:Uncharacterized protein n=1 Tax=Paenibacillus woosongensis TaxID=307580 RepID=A0A7X3CKW4_9BACL|nr:hypothetical protein [Paenibacillus woosongensis]MUG43408.1 hypothetical protein [Paenibacillus woosongensis]